jgi:hypothetical protein
MSNFKTSKLAVIAVIAGAVILFSTETTQAGGFSVRIGGLSFGSYSGCTRGSYIYISDYDYDYGCTSVWRERHCPRYRVRPYHGGGLGHRP